MTASFATGGVCISRAELGEKDGSWLQTSDQRRHYKRRGSLGKVQRPQLSPSEVGHLCRSSFARGLDVGVSVISSLSLEDFPPIPSFLLHFAHETKLSPFGVTD